MLFHSFLSLLALIVLFRTAFAEEECPPVTVTVTKFTYVTIKPETEATIGTTLPAIEATPTHDGHNGVKPPGVEVTCDQDANENHGACRPHHPTQFSNSSTDALPTASQHSFPASDSASNTSLASSVNAASSTSAHSFHPSVPTNTSTVYVTLTLVRAEHSSVVSTSTAVFPMTEATYSSTDTPVPLQSSSTAEAFSASAASTFSTSTLSARSSLPTYPWQGSYTDKVLYSHNIHRINHTVANLSWNQTLANAAYSWAQRCVFAHNTSSIPSGYGQNLAASAPTASISQHISDFWYNGEAQLYAPYYGQSSPPNLAAGHFTQVVWKGTGTVGCATVDCRRSSLGMWYTVCNYYPPGNYIGRYASNVLRPIGNPYVKGNASDIITRNSW